MGRIFLLITIITLLSLQAAAQPQNQANPNVITNEDINKIIENLKILQQNITDIQRQLEKLSETIRKDLTNIQKNITDIQIQLKILNETVIKIGQVVDIRSIILLLVVLSIVNLVFLFLLFRRRGVEIC